MRNFYLGKKLSTVASALALAFTLGVSTFVPGLAGTALAANANSIIDSGVGAACTNACNTTLSVNSVFSKVTNTLVFLIGAISVIMIVIGGLRYVLSNGDSKSAESARNTILYSVIGIILAVAAYAIVHFVSTSIK